MKKLLLTTLILITAFQGFSQKTEVNNLIEECFIRSVKVSESGKQLDTTLFISILDSAFIANPTEEITKKYASYSFRFKRSETFINSAETTLKKAVHKDKWYIYVILANNYGFKNEFKKCISTFEKASKYKEEEESIISSAISQSYIMLGKYDKAEDVLKKMIELDSNNYFAYCEYASLLNFMNRPDEAISILDYVTSDSFERSGYGNFVRIKLFYGHAYYLKGEYKKAIQYLKEQINKDNYWECMYYIGKSYEKLGDTGNACAYFNMFIETWNTEIADTIPEKLEGTDYTKRINNQLKDAQKQVEELNCE